MRGKPSHCPPAPRGLSSLGKQLASQCPSGEPQPSPPSTCPQHLPQVPGGGPQGRRVLGGADGHDTAGHQGQGLVRSKARLRVQVPAVRSAPVISTCASGDLPARPSNDPAEERCQVERGLTHVLQLPTRRPLHLVSARWRGHSLLGRLVRPKGHQQQHHHWAPRCPDAPEAPSAEP